MKFPFTRNIGPVVLGISLGAIIFLCTFMYTAFYRASGINEELSLEARYAIRVTHIDPEHAWLEGERVEIENRAFDLIRVAIDSDTYILERTPRIEGGVLVGYTAHHRATSDILRAGEIIYIGLVDTLEGFYAPIVIVDTQ